MCSRGVARTACERCRRAVPQREWPPRWPSLWRSQALRARVAARHRRAHNPTCAPGHASVRVLCLLLLSQFNSIAAVSEIPKLISAAALDGSDPIAVEAVDMLLAIVGQQAGAMALTCLAKGAHPSLMDVFSGQHQGRNTTRTPPPPPGIWPVVCPEEWCLWARWCAGSSMPRQLRGPHWGLMGDGSRVVCV